MKKKLESLLSVGLSAAALLTTVSFSGCSNKLGDVSQSPGTSTSAKPKIEILTTGWVNTPTNGSDPFKKWIDDKFGVDVTLTATSDFTNQVVIKFASDDQPDIVSFPNVTQFNKVFNQGSLLSDWTPYISKMPNFQKIISSEKEAGSVFERNGKLAAVWTLPDATTWSLKLRKDWLQKLHLQAPTTPEELLNVAKAFRNDDPDGDGQKDTYAFTTAGSGQDFGTLGTWIPLMFGDVNILPYGLYIQNNQVQFGILNGNEKKTLDYIRELISDDLIDPNWYVQTWDQSVLDKQGKIGIDWYPGVLAQETETNKGNKGTTIDWWETYNLPKEAGAAYPAGLLPASGVAGKIISVSAKSALDKNKMSKICALIDDVLMTPDGKRPEGYNALRWGVNVESGLQFVKIPNTSLQYINTTGNGKVYWDNVPGAWDWGSWFSRTGDGVVQGTTNQIGQTSLKVVELDQKTAQMKTFLEEGTMLSLDSTLVDKLTRLTNEFEYKYVTGKTNDYDGFVAQWKSQGGDQIMTEATKQFKSLGLIK